MKGQVRDGIDSPPMRGNRHLEEGRESVCPDPGRYPSEDVVDRHDMGRDDQPDPGFEGSSELAGREATGWRPP